MRNYITMSTKEAERVSVLEDLIGGRIKQRAAAKMLGITTRQVRRLVHRYREDGAIGLVHRSRGRRGNRAIDQEEKGRIARVIKETYHDFGPTFAHEKLTEHHGVSCSIETVRQIMIKNRIWRPKTKTVKQTHPRRPRRACVGELIQLDGSPHDWFEGRADSCFLLTAIDDATSRIMDGAFVEYEGTFPYFDLMGHYLETHGKPLYFYIDRHSTFKTTRKATIEEELRDSYARTQFSRAMHSLGIQLIFAHTPQAKGRVERLIETLQDRLIKEMRLLGISSKREGTDYFREVYIPKHNEKFAVAPRESADLHRPLLPHDDLSCILTVQSERVVTKDLQVRYQNSRYQLKAPKGYRYTLPKAKITVAENKKGEITFLYKNKKIPFTVADVQPKNQETSPVVTTKDFTSHRVHIPAPDHPWRQSYQTM